MDAQSIIFMQYDKKYCVSCRDLFKSHAVAFQNHKRLRMNDPFYFQIDDMKTIKKDYFS